MNTSPKLQRAGRAFLLRLVVENGAGEAAQILRDLADELAQFERGYKPTHGTHKKNDGYKCLQRGRKPLN